MVIFPQNWAMELLPFISLMEIEQLIEKSEELRNTAVVFPPAKLVFEALEQTPPQEVRCVIMGQDPYHQPNQAHGLSFSVNNQVKQPPSLRNMMKELYHDIGTNNPSILSTRNLSGWSRNGVLLLNRIFTVEQGLPMSHANLGWQKLSNAIIQYLNSKNTPIAFVFMGKPAQELAIFIENPQHLVLKIVHPSPLSAHQGFWGCKMYSAINTFLKDHNLAEIPWEIVAPHNQLF